MANENAIYIWGRTAPVVDKTSARQEVGHPWLQMFCFSITSQNRFSEQHIGDRYILNGDFRFDSSIITGDVVLDLFAASFESACLTLLILWPCVWMESKLGTCETKQHSKQPPLKMAFSAYTPTISPPPSEWVLYKMNKKNMWLNNCNWNEERGVSKISHRCQIISVLEAREYISDTCIEPIFEINPTKQKSNKQRKA